MLSVGMKIETRVYETLGSVPQRAIDISRSLGLDKKRVQQVLYKYQKTQKATRIEGTPPTWTKGKAAPAGESSIVAVQQPLNVGVSIEDQSAQPSEKDLKYLILEIFNDNDETNVGFTTTSIMSKLDVVMQKGEMNRLLYDLERDGCIVRHQRTPPIWSLSAVQREDTSSSNLRQACLLTKRKREEGVVEQCEHERDRAEDMLQRQREEVEKSMLDASLIHSSMSIANDEKNSWGERCAEAVWQKFRELVPSAYAHKTHVVAGFIIREQDNDTVSRGNCTNSLSLPRVVAIGSGNKCVGGGNFSLEGRMVHDSHAEIVARRSLMRWLYSQIETAGACNSYVVPAADESGMFELLPCELWLYVSKAPCGDAAIFSRADTTQLSEPGPRWNPKQKNSGFLRTKVECNQGTALTTERISAQSVDGLNGGEQLRSHSCSDKIARWNVLGLQGALLSRLLKDPLLLTGVVVGDVFSYGHICRALCCRSARALSAVLYSINSNSTSSTKYSITHMRICQAKGSGLEAAASSRHEKIKKSKHVHKTTNSLNWSELDKMSENISAVTGSILTTDGSDVSSSTDSRISKKCLFAKFCEHVPEAVNDTYAVNKEKALVYQMAKKAYTDAISVQFGPWDSKPKEFDTFVLT